MRTAAEKYSLATLSEAIEDEEASIVFFLLGPLSANSPPVEERNRALLAFRLKHIPGALVLILTPFAEEKINLVEIHSLYRKDGEHDFAIETECGKDQIASHLTAVERATRFATRRLSFGPFPLVSAA